VVRKRRIRLGTAAIAAALLSLPAANAGASSLSGSVGGGAVFPERTLIVSAPPGVPVTVPRIYIAENGKPVDDLTVTPLSHATARDFGVVIAVDQSESMAGVPLAKAMAAARAIAAKRTGNQELGLITFDSTPTTVLPLSSDARTIDRALATTPLVGRGTRILPAVAFAIQQLAKANIADGDVILLSDGASNGSSEGLTVQSVGAAAQADHYRIFTVGLRDGSFTPALIQQIAQSGGGQFVAATSAQLPAVFTGITSSLTSSYVVHYRSILRAGRHISVTVHVDGMPKLLNLRYIAPVPGKAAPSPLSTWHPIPRAQLHISGTHHAPAASASSPSPAASSGAVPKAAGAAPVGPVHAPVTAQPEPKWVPLPAARPSFWTSTLAVWAVAGICMLLIGLALAVLFLRHPARRSLQRRVHSFTLATDADAIGAAQTPAATGPIGRIITRASFWPGFVEKVQSARMRRSPLDLVRRTAVISLVLAVLLGYVTGAVVLGVLVLFAAPFLLKAFVSRAARKQQDKFNELLPSNLQDLAGAMRAGRSFVGGISVMAESANEPIRGEFERALADERLGLPLEETLEAIARRMDAKDMDQVALIAALNRKSGSNVAEALERVAESARERADLRREISALTGQARMSALVLTGMPPLMLLALLFIAPSYQRPLFHSTGGIVMLFIASGLLAMGWMVMKKIVNPDI